MGGYAVNSGHQPFVFFHAVQGDEGQQNRHGGDVFLVFGVGAVVLVLADLQAAGAAEHHEDDARIAHGHDDPLADAADGTNAANQHAGPENHLAQVVGAADDAVQAGVHEPSGIFLLGGVLLHVGGGLQHDATEHDECADVSPHIAAAAIVQAVEYAGDLGDVQQGAGDPDGDFHAEGNGLAVLNLTDHVLLVGAAFELPDGQITAQAAAVDDEQDAADYGAQAQFLAVQQHHQQTLTCDGEAVAQGDEPDIVFESDGADDHGGDKQPQEFDGEHRAYLRLIV